MSIGTLGIGHRWLVLLIACGLWPGMSAVADERPVGAPVMPPSTPIQLRGEAFFPVGIYEFPRHDPKIDVFKAIADAGFNLYLLPATASREQLDAAAANGVRIMLVVSDSLNLSGTPEQIAHKKEAIAKLVGPGSVAFDHPAVVALEGPDEPIWNVKMAQGHRDKLSPELATWVRTAPQKEEIYALLKGLRDGYAEVRRLCGDRYSIWINFAPRGDEDELRWFTGLPSVGGFPQDGRTTADVFGTDIYPVPDGGGNNGWIRGRLVASAAATGAFTEKLRRAVHPYPFYMVLHGCGIAEWDAPSVAAGGALRRPTFEEQQFMTFDAIVHGASGVLLWGANYVDDQSLYWRQIGRIHRQLQALMPVLTHGQHWADAQPGDQEVQLLGRTWKDEHYVLAVNNNPAGGAQGWIAVPGWRGDRAYSLLDGRVVTVTDGVIRDPMPPLAARVYADGPSLLPAFGWPSSDALGRRPMRTLFSLPTDPAPFKDKGPEAIAAILKEAGVDGVVQMPHDSKLVDALHAAGIRAYAEIGCFSGKEAWTTNPKTRPITAEGEPYDEPEGYGGVCVNQEEYVAELLVRIDRLCGEAKWDGLWLDFIRWPGRWEMKEPKLIPVCFCDTCLTRFTADRGVHCPKELTTPKEKAQWILREHAAAWTAWKCDCVTDVVARIRRVVKSRLGPDAVLGIFGVPMRQADHDGAILRTFGQDWAKLGPYVDVFSPMVYHIYCGQGLEWISQVTAEVAQRSGRTVWPIVQSCSVPTAMDVEEFERALRKGLEAPSSGIMVYSTNHTIQENKWETMSRVYREATSR